MSTWLGRALIITGVTAILIDVVEAQSRDNVVRCDPSSACFPWSSRGPFCGRGANINMRYLLQLTGPNFVQDSSLPEPVSNATYAFCPRVDELQAFNITRAGEISYTFINGTFGNIEFMTENQRFLSLVGYGDTRNVDIPQPGSQSRAMVADYFSGQGFADAPQCTVGSEIAVVPFLVFNISMDNGRFRYYEGHPQPAGVGFEPSCDSNNVCIFDSTMKCIGEPGNRNCAQCVTRSVARDMNVQVWVSYYGTDASGRQLRSGANNPLNFQAYSGSGVSSSMRRSFNNIKTGQQDPDGLEPAGKTFGLW